MSGGTPSRGRITTDGLLERLDRLAALMRREPRQRPVRAPRHAGEAGRQAAAIATRVLACHPDVALDRVVAIARPIPGRLTIGHVSYPSDRMVAVDVVDDHLFEDAAAKVEKAVRDVMLREMRNRAVRQDGGDPRHAPAWTIVATRPFVDMLDRMNITPSPDAEAEMGRRIDRAMRLFGGRSTMTPVETDGRVMFGDASTPWEPDGRPGLRVEHEVNRAQRLTVTNAPVLPETAMVNLVGRRLADVVDVGPLSSDMTIAKAEHTGRDLVMTLEGDLVTLAPVPEGLDARWLELEGASPRTATQPKQGYSDSRVENSTPRNPSTVRRG